MIQRSTRGTGRGSFLAKWQVGRPWLQHDHDGVVVGGRVDCGGREFKLLGK